MSLPQTSIGASPRSRRTRSSHTQGAKDDNRDSVRLSNANGDPQTRRRSSNRSAGRRGDNEPLFLGDSQDSAHDSTPRSATTTRQLEGVKFNRAYQLADRGSQDTPNQFPGFPTERSHVPLFEDDDQFLQDVQRQAKRPRGRKRVSGSTGDYAATAGRQQTDRQEEGARASADNRQVQVEVTQPSTDGPGAVVIELNQRSTRTQPAVSELQDQPLVRQSGRLRAKAQRQSIRVREPRPLMSQVSEDLEDIMAAGQHVIQHSGPETSRPLVTRSHRNFAEPQASNVVGDVLDLQQESQEVDELVDTDDEAENQSGEEVHAANLGALAAQDDGFEVDDELAAERRQYERELAARRAARAQREIQHAEQGAQATRANELGEQQQQRERNQQTTDTPAALQAPVARTTFKPKFIKASPKRPNKYAIGQNVYGRTPWSDDELDCLMTTLDYIFTKQYRQNPSIQQYSEVLKLHGPNGMLSQRLARRNNQQLKDKVRNEINRRLRLQLALPAWVEMLSTDDVPP